MARGSAQERPLGSSKGREGNRWINERPSSEQVAEWFKTIPLHDGMSHDKYVGGVTLIKNTEYSEEIKGEKIVKTKSLVWTPYPKVETRIAYFWDLMHAHPEWAGSIERVDTKDDRASHLGPGFFYQQVPAGERKFTFVGCTVQVRVLEREYKNYREQDVIHPPPATKLIPVLQTKYGGGVEPDPYAPMKAETGAIGRALGMAGMLIVPGAGVATAEDMQELGDGPPGEGAATQPQVDVEAKGGTQGGDGDAPSEDADADDVLRKNIGEKITRLESELPEKHKEFTDWAKGRKLTLDSASSAQLRGVDKKLDKFLEGNA